MFCSFDTEKPDNSSPHRIVGNAVQLSAHSKQGSGIPIELWVMKDNVFAQLLVIILEARAPEDFGYTRLIVYLITYLVLHLLRVLDNLI